MRWQDESGSRRRGGGGRRGEGIPKIHSSQQISEILFIMHVDIFLFYSRVQTHSVEHLAII